MLGPGTNFTTLNGYSSLLYILYLPVDAGLTPGTIIQLPVLISLHGMVSSQSLNKM